MRIFVMKIENRKDKQKDPFQYFFDHCIDGLAIVDCSCIPIESGKYLLVNKSLCKMLGYTKAELLKMSPAEIAAPDQMTKHIERVKTLNTNSKLCFETVCITKFGERYPTELTVSLSKYNKKVSAFSVYRNISERKSLESHLKQQYNEAKQRLQTNKAFVRGMIHELKTPITSLLGLSEILSKSLVNDPKLKVLARNCLLSTKKLDKRISDLIDLVKGEIGILQIKPKAVDISGLLQDIVSQRQLEAKKHGLEIELEIKSAPSILWADEDRLIQIIDNLLSNSIKFTKPNGQIRITSDVIGTTEIITVEDNGCGIPMKDQKVIFEPYSVNLRSKDNLSGFGMGLSLTKMLVNLHGGTISLSSRVHKGTRVSFTLPFQVG